MWSERAIGERVDIEGDVSGATWAGGKTKRYIGFTFALRLGSF